MALRVSAKKSVDHVSSPAVALYRAVTKQIPRLLTLYDLPVEPREARLNVQALFRQHAEVNDPRVVDMLIQKANMELEETLMMWKQKAHLDELLNAGAELRRQEKEEPAGGDEELEKFLAGIDDDDDDKI